MSESGDLSKISQFVGAHKQHKRTISDLSFIRKPVDPNSRIIPRGRHRGKRVSTYQAIPGTSITLSAPKAHSETINRSWNYAERTKRETSRTIIDRAGKVKPGLSGPRMQSLADRLVALRLRMTSL